DQTTRPQKSRERHCSAQNTRYSNISRGSEVGYWKPRVRLAGCSSCNPTSSSLRSNLGAHLDYSAVTEKTAPPAFTVQMRWAQGSPSSGTSVPRKNYSHGGHHER